MNSLYDVRPSQGFRALHCGRTIFDVGASYRRAGTSVPRGRMDKRLGHRQTCLSRNANCVRDGVEIIHDWCSHSRARMSEAKLWRRRVE